MLIKISFSYTMKQHPTKFSVLPKYKSNYFLYHEIVILKVHMYKLSFSITKPHSYSKITYLD